MVCTQQSPSGSILQPKPEYPDPSPSNLSLPSRKEMRMPLSSVLKPTPGLCAVISEKRLRDRCGMKATSNSVTVRFPGNATVSAPYPTISINRLSPALTLSIVGRMSRIMSANRVAWYVAPLSATHASAVFSLGSLHESMLVTSSTLASQHTMLTVVVLPTINSTYTMRSLYRRRRALANGALAPNIEYFHSTESYAGERIAYCVGLSLLYEDAAAKHPAPAWHPDPKAHLIPPGHEPSKLTLDMYLRAKSQEQVYRCRLSHSSLGTVH